MIDLQRRPIEKDSKTGIKAVAVFVKGYDIIYI